MQTSLCRMPGHDTAASYSKNRRNNTDNRANLLPIEVTLVTITLLLHQTVLTCDESVLLRRGVKRVTEGAKMRIKTSDQEWVLLIHQLAPL